MANSELENSPSTIRNSQSEIRNPTLLEWPVHPLTKNPLKSLFLVVFLISICLLIYISFNSIWLGILSGILLIGSLRKFFFITRYRLGAENIEVKTPFSRLVKRWDNFKSFYPDNNGILLSPFPDKSWLENFRGIYLLFPPKADPPEADKIPNSEQVIKFIGQKISHGK